MNPDRFSGTSTVEDGTFSRPRNRRLASSNASVPLRSDDGCSSSAHYHAHPYRTESPTSNTSPSRDHPIHSERSIRQHSSYGWTGVEHSIANGSVHGSANHGFWDSWPSLQSLASTVLGSDAQGSSKGTTSMLFKNPRWNIPGSTIQPQNAGWSQWGAQPHTGPATASGSREQRRAMVDAKKRETLLQIGDSEILEPKAVHKRRNSNQRPGDLASRLDNHEGDILVYVHQVKPEDTVAGIVIRYQCQPAIFRKVNRLWPNDKVQIRDHVFLPVEACAIRGRKIDTGITEDTRSSEPASPPCSHRATRQNLSRQTDPGADHILRSPSEGVLAGKSAGFQHEYYVSVPEIPESIEIARVPRRTLGFFPPPRRKPQSHSPSQSYHDSPRSSVEKPRLSSGQGVDAGLTARHRSVSSTSTSPIHLASHLRLAGPGGVGPLRNPASSHRKPPDQPLAIPGPGPDRLNTMFANHFPDLVLPMATPPAALSLALHSQPSFRDSCESSRSVASSGLDNVGGVIEGWARKFGTRLTGGSGSGSKIDTSGMSNGMGDLIELEDSGSNFENELDSSSSPEPRLRDPSHAPGCGSASPQPSPEDVLWSAKSTPRPRPVNKSGNSSAEDDDMDQHSHHGSINSKKQEFLLGPSDTALLEERFPPAGKIIDAQTTKPLSRV